MKKNSVYIIGCALCTFLWLACKSTNSPKAVTETFLVSLARLDIKTAKNYSTRETWNFLKVLDKKTNKLTPEEKEIFIDNFKVKILSQQQINDSLILIKFTTKPVLLPFDELHLKGERNIEGDLKWKVNITTEKLIEADTTIQEIMEPTIDSTENVLIDAQD